MLTVDWCRYYVTEIHALVISYILIQESSTNFVLMVY